MKGKRQKKLLLWLLPPLIGGIMRLWFGTCRVRVHGGGDMPSPGEEQKGPFIVIFWHYSIAFILFFLRQYDATVLVSASNDGDYFTRLAQHFGFRTVRGSRNRKGVQALKELFRVVGEKRMCGLVADGSQGPPLILQPGSVLLASRGGIPIRPVVWSASSCFLFRSWDRLAIPKPFSQIHFFYGAPIQVPAGLKGDELEEWRQEVEYTLLELYEKAWKIFDKKRHDAN